jgi:hypothetical protein
MVDPLKKAIPDTLVEYNRVQVGISSLTLAMWLSDGCSTAAAQWAIYQLIEEGRLRPAIYELAPPNWQKQWYFHVYPTQRLWDWWAAPSPTQKDGPVGVDGFRLQGHEFEDLTPLDMRILTCLWGNGTLPDVNVEKAIVAVYDEAKAYGKMAAFESAYKRLNRKLRKQSRGTISIQPTRGHLRIIIRKGQ